MPMRTAFDAAVSNVIRHGDTDIFPFPIENYVFFDAKQSVVDILMKVHNDFDEILVRFPPAHETSLAPISYHGFRWGTQLDPFWNAYFLGCVLSVADKIEAARLPIADNAVFSYRYKYDPATGDLFDPSIGWIQFMTRSNEIARKKRYVVICDISEFYPRIGHHRVDNALHQLGVTNEIPKRIITFLGNYSNNRSFGLPIGGPGARLISELVLNQIDRLLKGEGLEFVRFADDYHIFADSMEEAYEGLIFLSEKLHLNQGLSLQRSKTRILSGNEFVTTNPLGLGTAPPGGGTDGTGESTSASQNFLRLSLRFDPYSPTAEQDYESLKAELKKFDILGLRKRCVGTLVAIRDWRG